MPLHSLWSPVHSAAKAHFVGVCGAGMKALAEVLVDRGWEVSGCDGDPDPRVLQSLQKVGVDVGQGHSTDHLQAVPDLLVYSAAVPETNCERQWARQQNIPQISYAVALAELTRVHNTFAIAGTHGKSTTTALLGAILRSVGHPASLICGAELSGLDRSGWAGDGTTLVVEACEFRRHFLDLHPNLICLLGIEPDHFDCYPTLHHAEVAYRQFIERLPKTGTLVYGTDCRATQRVAAGFDGRRKTFSLTDSAADWRAVKIESTAAGMRFRILLAGSESPWIDLPLPGLHNVRNALAAAACAGELGLSLEQIAQGLTEFQGVKRRFEVCGTSRGAIVIDDYAHHPTEIQATLSAARQQFPGKRLICIFQPHQISRTEALLEDFVNALGGADEVFLLPVYAARETADGRELKLIQQLHTRIDVPSTLISSLDQVRGTVQTGADCNAVLLTLGAGNLSRICHDLIDGNV